MKEPKNAEPLTFEQAYERLDAIVRQLDEGELKLDELENQFEEGMRMAAFCSKRLEEVEQKVSLLVEKAQAGLEREPFDRDDLEG